MHDRFAEHTKAERALAVRATEFGFVTFLSIAIRGIVVELVAAVVVRGHLDWIVESSISIKLVIRDVTHAPTSIIWAPAARRDDLFSAKQPNDRRW